LIESLLLWRLPSVPGALLLLEVAGKIDECTKICLQRRYDMNGRSQMKGGKNDFVERDKCKPVVLRLSLAGNLEKPLMSLCGTA